MIFTNSTTIGTEELMRKLEDISKVHAKRAIRKGSRAGAKIIQAQAVRTAPIVSGTLQRNIKVRSMPRSRRFTGTTVKESSPHAGFTEFGTKRSKGDHNIEQAFDAVKAQATDTFLSVMADEIDKVGK